MSLPFWILSFWERIGKAIEVQKCWSCADDWVRKYATSVHPKAVVAQDALRFFDAHPWDLPLTGLVADLSNIDLAGFLSESLVKSSVVDAMMTSIAREVKHVPQLAGKVSVQDLTFSEILRLPEDRWQHYNIDRAFTKLQELGKALANGSLTRVIIPLNIASVHWALFLVDATTQLIQYGDSLGWSVPQEDVNRLNHWLHQHGFQSFKIGPLLPHGRQLDNYSCSVAMANIARHALFGDPLFNDTDKHFFRIQEFVNMTASSESAPSNQISEFADDTIGTCRIFGLKNAIPYHRSFPALRVERLTTDKEHEPNSNALTTRLTNNSPHSAPCRISEPPSHDIGPIAENYSGLGIGEDNEWQTPAFTSPMNVHSSTCTGAQSCPVAPMLTSWPSPFTSPTITRSHSHTGTQLCQVATLSTSPFTSPTSGRSHTHIDIHSPVTPLFTSPFTSPMSARSQSLTGTHSCPVTPVTPLSVLPVNTGLTSMRSNSCSSSFADLSSGSFGRSESSESSGTKGMHGLMRYFSRVAREDFLEAIRVEEVETCEKRLDNARKAEEDKHSREYEKAAKKRLGARERQQRLRAKKKARLTAEDTKTINKVLHDTPLSHVPYPEGVAEASRPYRAFKEENHTVSRLGRKRKHEGTLAIRVCWQEHHLWSQILHAVNVVGLPWSPTDILKQLQSTNATAFSSLTTQVIGRWIDRSGAKPKWTDTVIKRAERGRQVGPITRKSILGPYPEVVASIVDQLRKLRASGVGLDTLRCRGIIIGQLYHSVPEIFETPLRDGSLFQASDTWVKKFLHDRLNWTFRRSTQAAQKLPANVNEIIQEHFLRLVLTMRNCMIGHPAFDVNIVQTNFIYQPNCTSTFEVVGSKQVGAVGKEEKRAATLVVGASGNGDLLVWQSIYEGKSWRSLPDKNCPGFQEAHTKGFLINYSNTDTYWSTFDLMCQYVTGILVPYWTRKKAELGAPPDQECVLRLDVWSVHRSIAFRTWLDKTYPWIRYLFIPGGCTGVAQPCDVGLQRLIKLEIKRRQHADIVEETLALLRDGTPPSELKLDTRIGTLRNRSINWLVHAYNAVNKPDIVKKVGCLAILLICGRNNIML